MMMFSDDAHPDKSIIVLKAVILNGREAGAGA